MLNDPAVIQHLKEIKRNRFCGGRRSGSQVPDLASFQIY
jgi:hypothetical protein